MLVSTYHDTILGTDSTGKLVQIGAIDGLQSAVRVDIHAQISDTINHPHTEIRVFDSGYFWAKCDGRYLCAEPGSSVAFNRQIAAEWETFRLIPEFYAHSLLGGDASRFAATVLNLNSQGRPVKVQMACGLFPEMDFLNVDLGIAAPDFFESNSDRYFAFPTVGHKIPVPDNSVDYVFHEDFFEHIGQIDQIQFLAEILRILKPGCVHRINTPDLLWTMSTHSKFFNGFSGVYTGERQWDHIGIMTKKHLEELALLVGYREVVFNGRGQGVSPHAIPDKRPFDDRDAAEGNIFADLIK